MQEQIVEWYHHFLLHPGETRMTQTIKKKLWWKGMSAQIKEYVASCVTCKKFKKSRKKYGKLPVKEVNDEIIPWETV